MSRHASGPRAAAATAITAALVILAACGGKSGGVQPASACPAFDGPEYATAVETFIDSLDPAPARFLTYPSGDSALPDGARSALEQKGPTYLFPLDSTLQKKQLADLEAKGSFPTLLVLYLGTEPQGQGKAARFTGRFVDKDDTGKAVSPRAVAFECRDHQWQTAAPATPAASPSKST